MKDKILLNDLLKFEINDFEKIRIRFCMKNYEPKYAIDDYKIDKDKVNEDWFLWRTNKRNFKVGQIAICLVRIYDTNEWLLTSIKEIIEELDVRDEKGFIGKELKQYEKYFGKVLIKFNKDFQQGCVKYITVANRMEVIDTNYNIEER